MIGHKTILTVLLGAMFLASRPAKADDETSTLAGFNQALQAADAGLVEAAYKKTNTNQPSKEQVEKFVTTIVGSAMDAMDREMQFEKHFPESKQIGRVRESLAETLWKDFGGRGLPVPNDRANDVEGCVSNLLHFNPKDASLYMILVRAAAALPIAAQPDRYRALSADSTPEPARQMARDALSKLERVGQPLDFSFTALDGRKLRLAELRGKVVLVDFWSTTCVPCVREIPDLKRLYEKFHTNGLEVIGVSLDSNKAALTRFIEKEKISWPQCYDLDRATNQLATQYGITAIPVMWLVDKHGVLRQLDARSDQEKKVKTLLEE
jgi:peroxiredoxin